MEACRRVLRAQDRDFPPAQATPPWSRADKQARCRCRPTRTQAESLQPASWSGRLWRRTAPAFPSAKERRDASHNPLTESEQLESARRPFAPYGTVPSSVKLRVE